MSSLKDQRTNTQDLGLSLHTPILFQPLTHKRGNDVTGIDPESFIFEGNQQTFAPIVTTNPINYSFNSEFIENIIKSKGPQCLPCVKLRLFHFARGLP